MTDDLGKLRGLANDHRYDIQATARAALLQAADTIERAGTDLSAMSLAHAKEKAEAAALREALDQISVDSAVSSGDDEKVMGRSLHRINGIANGALDTLLGEHGHG